MLWDLTLPSWSGDIFCLCVLWYPLITKICRHSIKFSHAWYWKFYLVTFIRYALWKKNMYYVQFWRKCCTTLQPLYDKDLNSDSTVTFLASTHSLWRKRWSFRLSSPADPWRVSSRHGCAVYKTQCIGVMERIVDRDILLPTYGYSPCLRTGWIKRGKIYMTLLYMCLS
jgi:hypothetical protein